MDTTALVWDCRYRSTCIGSLRRPIQRDSETGAIPSGAAALLRLRDSRIATRRSVAFSMTMKVWDLESGRVSVGALVDGDASTIIDGFPVSLPAWGQGMERKGKRRGGVSGGRQGDHRPSKSSSHRLALLRSSGVPPTEH